MENRTGYGIAAMLVLQRMAYRMQIQERRELVADALQALDRMGLTLEVYEEARALLLSLLK